jgi:hypothetical protein
VVVQPVKAPSNHKMGTYQPKEPENKSPQAKAKPDSRVQGAEHLFDTTGLSDTEPGLLSPKIVPQRKTRAAKSVSKVQLPPSPATSHSRPRVKQPCSREAKHSTVLSSKTINLPSGNGNTTSTAEVSRTRGAKRKRVIESDEESEPTAKKPKSGSLSIERTPSSPRPKGSMYKTQPHVARANPHSKTPPALVGVDNEPEPPKSEEMKPPARVKQPEVQPTKPKPPKETVGKQPKAQSSSRSGNNGSKASECELIFVWGAEPSPVLIPVAPVLRSKGGPKGRSSTSPTRQRVIESLQGTLPPVSLPDPEPKGAKVTGGYDTRSGLIR